MQGHVIRVAAYYGAPVFLGQIPTRHRIVYDAPVEASIVINDLDNEVVLDLNATQKESDHDLDHLVNEFQDEFKCKVNYDELGRIEDGVSIYGFDIFEPSWQNAGVASVRAKSLRDRLLNWVRGYPRGRALRGTNPPENTTQEP
jgi:hypothetical protein